MVENKNKLKKTFKIAKENKSLKKAYIKEEYNFPNLLLV